MTTPSREAPLRTQLADGSLAGNWTLDPARSTATLKSRSMWGLVPVKGTFRKMEGAGTVSPTGEVTGRIELAADSVNTKNAKRDTHLRSPDFFHAEKYPAIIFTLDKLTPAATSDNLTPAADNLTAEGTLTVRDASRPLTFPATATLAADGEIVLDATVQVDRSHHGLTWNQLGMASMHNTITIHAAFTKA
jgi:polyisoprenoid-binding protein YceI